MGAFLTPWHTTLPIALPLHPSPPFSVTFHLFIQLYVLAASVRSPRQPLSNVEYTRSRISETCPVTSSSIPTTAEGPTAGWVQPLSRSVCRVPRCPGKKWKCFPCISEGYLSIYFICEADFWMGIAKGGICLCPREGQAGLSERKG